MTVSVYLTSASFTKHIGNVSPQPEGLQVLSLLKVDAVQSTKNQVVGASIFPEVSGNVLYTEVSALGWGSTNYIDTGYAPTASESDEITMVALMKMTSGNSKFFGNFNGSVGDMVDIVGGTRTLRVWNNAVQSSVVMDSIPAESYRMVGMSGKDIGGGNVVNVICHSNNGALITESYQKSGTRATNVGTNLFMGKVNAGSGDPGHEIAAYLIWNRALSPSELAEVYDWLVSAYQNEIDIV